MAETWMTMIFRHGFFHGDPHPANILVLGRPTRSG
jgi:predicted unusual protein kinase regulating ubiquinone biosynthesis (AarF/ABC1/UbiB family)